MRFTWYIIFVWWEFPNIAISPAFLQGQWLLRIAARTPDRGGEEAVDKIDPGYEQLMGIWIEAIVGESHWSSLIMRHVNDPCHPTGISISQEVLSTALLVSWHRKGWMSTMSSPSASSKWSLPGILDTFNILQTKYAGGHCWGKILQADKFDIRDRI